MLRTPGRGGRGGAPGAGAQSDIFQRPTDVAWNSAGNIYVADGMAQRPSGEVRQKRRVHPVVGIERGSAEGQFNTVHGIALDAQGNVYVADGDNKRIQVFDGDGNFKTAIVEYRYVLPRSASLRDRTSTSTAPTRTRRITSTRTATFTRSRWTGKSSGKFGRAGKLPKEFGTVNAIDCRRDNELLVGEQGNWRVQKVTLH